MFSKLRRMIKVCIYDIYWIFHFGLYLDCICALGIFKLCEYTLIVLCISVLLGRLRNFSYIR
jgi:hypothetical protein